MIEQVNEAESGLHSRLNECRDAERAAEEALQEAQLAAVQGGPAVPGRLVQALADAQRTRVEVEGAIAAFERGVEMGAQATQSARRQLFEQRVNEAASEFTAAGLAFIDGLRDLLNEPGERLTQARLNLQRATTGVGTSTLTDVGWVTSEGLASIRGQLPEAMMMTLLGKMLEHLGESKARELVQSTADSVVRAVRILPPNFPGA